MRPRVTVLGSINLDLIVRCTHLPRPGETLIAESSQQLGGGKGANQAVAAARAGGDVRMIGRVGDDSFAQQLLENLQRDGIDCSAVRATRDCASGFAIVAVETSGQNSILVVPGANDRLDLQDVSDAHEMIESSDVLLVQLEVPVETVIAATDVANRAGVRVILDPAPAPRDPTTFRCNMDLICPNESEAEALIGSPIRNLRDAEKAAISLQQRFQCHVAITLGDQGTMLAETSGHTNHIPAIEVKVCDTTAAGDAFAGALAVYWAEHDSLTDAVRFANCAGAIAASREGAQPAMAARAEIESRR